MYKTINNHPDMGLENKICEFKDYFCTYHQVYLSTEDVRRKKCLNKPTFDMLGTYKCPHIRQVDEEGELNDSKENRS